MEDVPLSSLLIVLILCVLFSAFFSATETAIQPAIRFVCVRWLTAEINGQNPFSNSVRLMIN